MGEIIICIFANMFRVYIVYRFIKVFFGKARIESLTEIIAYCLYFVINTGLYISYHLAWLNIVNTLLGMFLLILLYTTSIKKGIFIASLIYVVNMICDIVSTLPFVSYQDGKNTDQILFVIGDLLFLIIELLTERIVDLKENEKEQKLPLILVPICSVFTILFLTYQKEVLGFEIVVVGIGLLIINFLILHLYNILIRTLAQSYENEMLAQNASMYLYQLNLIKQNEENILVLRHDMRHHLMELKILAENGNNRELQNYINSMEEYIQNPNEVSISGNTDVDSLLNYIIKVAKEKLKVVNIKVQLPEKMPNIFDVNIVLGNILENAIEAASKTDEKIVRGSIVFKNGVLQIRIENSYNGVLEKEKKNFLTTKKDKEIHGIGLRSVYRILKKYNGDMELLEESLFCVNAIMYLPDENK